MLKMLLNPNHPSIL